MKSRHDVIVQISAIRMPVVMHVDCQRDIHNKTMA
jgi:hypothetical protein